MVKKYYENIDVLRGFAIVLVVLGHALDPANILTDSVTWCNGIHAFIYSFHMPLFFAISGFCVFEIKSYGQFIKKKIRYILVPYIVFNIIVIPLRRLLPQFSLTSNSLKDTIISILAYGGEIWFLYVLFEIFIIAPFLIKLIDNKMIRFAIVEIVLAVLYWVAHDVNVFEISQVLYYMIFFLAGNILQKRNVITERYRLSVSLRFICMVAAFGVQILLLHIYQNIGAYTAAYVCIKIVLAAAGCVFSYMLVGLVFVRPVRNALKNYGSYSLQIYLFNGYFISVSRTVFLSMLAMPIPIVVLLNFVFGMFFNYIWCYFILKLSFVRFLCGKKQPM